ncbi:MAG TPA: hypothetical protein PLR06_04465 [Cyclobacteriaceae bacterium]|nr:hypothetical protein [Cyclobacteriaceae bacterium]
MKACIFFCVWMAVFTVGAQDISELDKKGGFKNFHIGDELSVHYDNIKFTKTLDNADTKLYLVKELVSVKTYTGEVELRFYKDKIQEVIVSFKNSSKDGYDDLFESLNVLYGQGQPFKDKSPKFDRFEKMSVWNGEKIGLRLSYDANRKLSQMVYYAQKNQLEKLKDDF